MTLEQWSFVAQIVSAMAVIATLTFFGIQLHKATSAIRATSSQANSALYTQIVQSIAEHRDLARVWWIGRPSACPTEHRGLSAVRRS